MRFKQIDQTSRSNSPPLINGEYTHKRIENRYNNTFLLPKLEEEKEIIEERKKYMNGVSLSIKDMKRHKKSYETNLKVLELKNLEKRKKEQKESKSIVEKYTAGLYKSSFEEKVIE